MTAANVARGTANRRRGHQAERDLARWLRNNGFPHAERAVRTGFRTLDRASADPGDITGTPFVLWSVKDCAVEQIGRWMCELDDMTDNAQTGGCLALLVHKRRGHADPARWWCWQWQSQYLHLYRTWLEQFVEVQQVTGLPVWVPTGTEYPMRMELGHVVPLVRAAGYGEPLPVVSPSSGEQTADSVSGSTPPGVADSCCLVSPLSVELAESDREQP